MTAGDFNGDRVSDLVVPAPTRSVNGHSGAGAVFIYPGARRTGINPNNVLVLTQDTPGAPGPSSDNANFGVTLGVGDFNGDGVDDLAVGADQAVGGHTSAGAVDVFYGSPAGLSTAGAQLFTEGSSGQRTPTDGDNFGAGLAAGRFGDEDEAADGLAVTIGGKQVGLANGAGAVEIFHSEHGRLSPSNTGYLTQNDFPSTMAQTNAGFGCYFGNFDNELASSSSPF